MCAQLSYISSRAPHLLYKDKPLPQTSDEAEDEASESQAGDADIVDEETTEVDLSELLRYDFRHLTNYGRYLILEATPHLEHMDAFIKERQLKLQTMTGKQEEDLRVKVDNDIKLMRIKIVALLKTIDRLLYTINLVSKHGIHYYYDLYDTCSFFLIKFKDYVDIGQFTEIAFMLIRRNSQRKNDDLLYLYR